ncbi:hypothetical protein [Pseudonocardia xishanensis]|uniref:Uncharacterized protein n=1 Tax=Pseudonocardia xishanensis TaxID=630995 RepID=A0ABP8RWY5_9PSEU
MLHWTQEVVAMHVPGHWRVRGWVRSYFRGPHGPGVEQLSFPEEAEIPRPREPEPDPARAEASTAGRPPRAPAG